MKNILKVMRPDWLAGKNVMLFLDFDGTLSPIAKTPERAKMSKKIRNILIRLSKSPRIKLAIISGRKINDVRKKVGIKRVIYCGLHGLEIKGPGIAWRLKYPAKYRFVKNEIKNRLVKETSRIKGIIIEDKDPILAMHYRLLGRAGQTKALKIFERVVAEQPKGFKAVIKCGKKVREIWPPVGWNKGKAVLWILGKITKKAKGLTIYIGDDKTDEDAFAVMKKSGWPVFVGRPGKTRARYYLNNTKQVFQYLLKLNGYLEK